MLLSRFVAVILSAELLILGTGAASGQDYPAKPIRIYAGAAGGGGDFAGRLVAQGISPGLGQPVIVENRANGVIAAEVVSKSPPDGYSLALGGGSTWTFQLLQNAPYDVMRDFAAVSLLVREVFIIAVHPSLPVKSIKELIALANARPGELNYSSVGTGGSAHLATESFLAMAGAKIVHVPYKGNAAAITALISGEVQMTISDAGLLAPHIKAGKVRGLAVTSATPSALAPGMPTVAESGVPGYEAIGATGLFAPIATHPTIINRLNQEIARFLVRPETKEKFFSAGAEVVASTPEQFAAFVRSDMNKMAKVIKDVGIKSN